MRGCHVIVKTLERILQSKSIGDVGGIGNEFLAELALIRGCIDPCIIVGAKEGPKLCRICVGGVG